jgi:hypothetical protein
MLPTRSGFAPYLLAFKQHPNWHNLTTSPGLDLPDIPEDDL